MFDVMYKMIGSDLPENVKSEVAKNLGSYIQSVANVKLVQQWLQTGQMSCLKRQPPTKQGRLTRGKRTN